jgi:UDP-glucose 4-epimerase
VGIDCFTDYYARAAKECNLAGLRRQERFRLIEADLLDLDLRRLLQGDAAAGPNTEGDGHLRTAAAGPIEYVYHLAAQPGVRGSWGETFEVYTRNNILATQRLLEAARGMPLKKFVYASSSSIYGNAETYPTHEDLTPRPVSPYGVSKLAAEHLCFLYGYNYGLPVAALRYFTVYGPRQRPDMAFHRFIRAMARDERIDIYGDGEQTRDFTFVADAVEGTVRAATSDVVGQVFNLGGGSRVTVNQVVRQLEAILGRKARVRYVDPQHGDARHTAADIRRAERSLGYKPHYSLEAGIRAEVNWLQSSFNPVEAV